MDEHMEADLEYGSAPYMFEPEYTDEELRQIDEEKARLQAENSLMGDSQTPRRIDNLDWCFCGNNCTIMAAEQECLCCAEFYLWRPETDDRDSETDDHSSPCITNCDEFAAMTNRAVLETFFLMKKINWTQRPTPAGPDGHLSNEYVYIIND